MVEMGAVESTPPPAARRTSQVAATRSGGSTVWGASAAPISLDPHASTSEAALLVWGDLVYQGLTMFDQNFKVVPALAESWTNPDPTTWLFTLRRGVRFHDSQELRADDVVFWHQRITAAATAAPDRAGFAAIAAVEPVGMYRVRVTLNTPYAPLLTLLAGLRGSAIVSSRAMHNFDLERETAGTGPFRVAEYVAGSHVTYTRHGEYWERDLPYLQTVTLKLVSDAVDLVDELRSGRVRHASIGPDQARELADARDVRVLEAPGARQWVHHVNVGRPPFDDVRVRRAVALALDRRAAYERVFGGRAVLTGPIPPGLTSWATPSERLPYRHDLGAARLLLAEAGLPEGFDTVVVTADEPRSLGLSTILAEQLRGIGVRAQVHRVNRGSLLQLMQARDYDIVADENGFSPDPDGYLTPTYARDGARNLSRWGSERFDQLLQAARTTIEPPTRQRLYEEAQRTLLDEAPSIWWCAENQLEALHHSQKGYHQSYTGRSTFLKTTWVEN